MRHGAYEEELQSALQTRIVSYACFYMYVNVRDVLLVRLHDRDTCGVLVIDWLSSVCVCCACVARDELSAFMESAGASSPGVLKLTTSLSMPFTRLDKYSNLLKEVERHTDSAHADRGDTQRAISVYREIAVRNVVACYVTADVGQVLD